MNERTTRSIDRHPKATGLAAAIGLSVVSLTTGCEGPNESRPAVSYVCSEPQTWTVQAGNSLSVLLYESGALEEASGADEDQKLLSAISHKAARNGPDFPDEFTVDITGSFKPSRDPVIFPGQDLDIPTSCTRVESD